MDNPAQQPSARPYRFLERSSFCLLLARKRFACCLERGNVRAPKLEIAWQPRVHVAITSLSFSDAIALPRTTIALWRLALPSRAMTCSEPSRCAHEALRDNDTLPTQPAAPSAELLPMPRESQTRAIANIDQHRSSTTSRRRSNNSRRNRWS